MDKLNPDALAECGEYEEDKRPGVQSASRAMIFEYVIDTRALPAVSARPFSAWLDECWNDWNEDGWLTTGAVIIGALAHWRGGA